MDVLRLELETAKIVTKLLNFEQKEHRMDIAQQMLKKFNGNPYVITGDESWVYGYDIETKAQSS